MFKIGYYSKKMGFVKEFSKFLRLVFEVSEVRSESAQCSFHKVVKIIPPFTMTNRKHAAW